jgi:hypothetical protein
MKYAEYQIWFHTFNNAYAALVHSGNRMAGKALDCAKEAADLVVKKFQEVQTPETPEFKMDGIDLQDLVNTVARNVTGNKRKM